MERNLLAPLDWVMVLVYVGFMVGLGVAFGRRQKSTDHYFTAGRRIPGWAAGISLYATLLSSYIFIAFPGQTYQDDWQLMMQQFTAPLIVVCVAIFIIPVFRRVIRVSAYEYLERRFGYPARVYGTIGFLGEHFFKMGVVMSTMALAVASITGWNQDAVIVSIGVATILYTLVGGIEGVIWTDVAQGLLMLGSSLLVVVFIIFFGSDQGPQAVLQASLTPEKLHLIDPTFDMTRQTVWVITFFGLVHFTMRYVTDQTLVQRYLTAPTLREARKGALISVGACMIAWIVFPLIGTLLYGFYQLHPERLDASITKGDQAFPYFIGRELPQGLTGLVLVGLLAASMSTLSSEMNSFGACVVSDFYARFRRGASDRRRLLISRATVLILGVAAVALALAISRQGGGIMLFVVEVWAVMGAVLMGGIIAIFFLGFFTRRANATGLYLALVCGLVFVLWCLATGSGWIKLPAALSFLEYHWHRWWLMGLSNILVFGLGYAFSLVVGSKVPTPHDLTAYSRIRETTAPVVEAEGTAQ